MAIVVLNEPTEFFPIFHSSVFKLDSTNKGQTNFKYVFRIFVNAVEVRSLKVSPEPVNGHGFLDVRNHLLDFLNVDIFDITDVNFQDAAKTEYIMKIDESYIDVGGNPILNVDEHVFAEKIAFDTKLNRNDFFGDLTKLQISTATPGEMLINIKPLSLVYQDDVFFIHFSGKNLAPVRPHHLQIFELNKSGGALATHFVSGDLATNSQLITMDLSTIVFNAATHYIEFRFVDTDTNRVTDPIRLLVEPRPCTAYTPIKLIYKGAKGSFLSLNFDGISTQDFKNKSKTFRKYIDPLTETEQSRGIQRFFQDTTEKFKINTFFTEEENNLMFEDLMRSDRVFIDLRNDAEFSNVDFFPVEVLKNSFKPIKTENKGDIPQFAFDIRFAFEQIDR